jgi:hypothetical protein
LGSEIQVAKVKKPDPVTMSTYQVEEIKRKIKRSGVMMQKDMDLANELFDGIPEEVTKKLHKLLGFEPNTRDLISASISSYLPEIVSTLSRIGIRSWTSGRQRPRKIDTVAWKNLEAAEDVTGLSKVLLLRACLTLMCSALGEFTNC